MKDFTEEFIEIRDYLRNNLMQMAEVYLTCAWDPLTKFLIIKETNKLIDRTLGDLYPDFPQKFLPKVKFRIFEEDHEIEAGVQQYLNTSPELTFLGTNDVSEKSYDYYLRKSFDPSCEYMFFARYGHQIDNVYSGAKVAAAEYFQGAMTPLSVAFGMAVEDGFIA